VPRKSGSVKKEVDFAPMGAIRRSDGKKHIFTVMTYFRRTREMRDR
jgi:hypothetical protein